MAEIGGNRVWYRVMDVQDVEIDFPAQGRQLAGKRNVIRRISKQRVIGDIDLMKEDVFVFGAQPERKGMADEMDLVTPF